MPESGEAMAGSAAPAGDGEDAGIGGGDGLNLLVSLVVAVVEDEASVRADEEREERDEQCADKPQLNQRTCVLTAHSPQLLFHSHLPTAAFG